MNTKTAVASKEDVLKAANSYLKYLRGIQSHEAKIEKDFYSALGAFKFPMQPPNGPLWTVGAIKDMDDASAPVLSYNIEEAIKLLTDAIAELEAWNPEVEKSASRITSLFLTGD